MTSCLKSWRRFLIKYFTWKLEWKMNLFNQSKRLLFFLFLLSVSFLFSCTPALHQAVRDRDHNKLQKLISEGSDLEDLDSYYNGDIGYPYLTAVELAAIIGDAKSFKLLVEGGAIIDTPDIDKYVFRGNDIEVAKVYVQSSNRFNTRKCLEYAVSSYSDKSAEMIQLLIESGANLKEDSDKLMFIANHPRAFELLIEAGADVNAKNAEGETPMFNLVLIRPPHVSEGWPIDKIRQIKQRALEYLIGADADPNAKNNIGITPLMQASEHGFSEAVALLTQSESNPLKQNDKRKTALDIANAQYQYVQNWLEKYSGYAGGTGGNSAVHRIRKRIPLMRNLDADLEKVVSMLEQSEKDAYQRYYPLHYSVLEKDIRLLSSLVKEKETDVNSKDNEGQTALHLSASNNFFNGMSLLLSFGADPFLKNRNGKTPKAIAKRNREQKLVRIIEVYEQKALDKITQESDSKDIQLTVLQTGSKTKQDRLGLFTSKISINQKYHAIVIGNNNYRHLKSLKTPISDVNAIRMLLEKEYGFHVTRLTDATRFDILNALNNARKNLTAHDNLLVYYAGHGWLDKEADRGYWIPIDAEPDSNINWVSNASITDAVKAMQAKHVLVVSDSCYSGKLTRGINLSVRQQGHLKKLARKKARTVLTSGGLEPVADSGGGNHSIFAKAFLNALRENQGVLDGHQLLSKIRRPVMLNSDQTPEYSDIREAGHDGGDFLFVRK